MSRKKKHDKTTGITTKPTSPVADANGAAPATAVMSAEARDRTRAPASPAERLWFEKVVVRMSRWLGSLQVAVLFLSLFVIVLAVGTIVESWYSDRVAKDLVYQTWWFNLLLILLGVNIFFAAAKKWPWKKYQTGFLVTHVGLLTLVAGGLLTGIGGVDTSLPLVASDDQKIQSETGLPQASNWVSDRLTQTIRVREIRDGGKEEPKAFPFQPGSLPWRADEYIQPNLHPLLMTLDILDHPWPRSWSSGDLGKGASLEVLNYYPHARKEKFKPAGPDDTRQFPAVQVALTASMPGMKMNQDYWVAGAVGQGEASIARIGVLHMLGQCPEVFLEQFRKAPLAGGEKGRLVLHVDGVPGIQEVDVAKSLDQTVSIKGSGWKVKIASYEANFTAKGGDGVVPVNPLVGFELTSPDGKTGKFATLARLPTKVVPMGEDSSLPVFKAVQTWYDAPDVRYGDEGVKSVLEFVTDPAGKLHYRSFSSTGGKFAFDKTGTAIKDETYPVWSQTVGWKFRVVELLPDAAPGPWFIPEDLRAGLEDRQQKYQPALRCKLHVGNDAKEFWVGRTAEGMTPVTVGGRRFEVGFNDNKIDLGFEIKLLRAETLVDPGTTQRAGYTSWVRLTDKDRKIEAEDRLITMNAPAEHRGYKFFQSSLESAGVEGETLKPISYSGFTVSRDPGLWMKYLGSSMLALGIVLMFYMKAYFFKPRGRGAARGGEGN